MLSCLYAVQKSAAAPLDPSAKDWPYRRLRSLACVDSKHALLPSEPYHLRNIILISGHAEYVSTKEHERMTGRDLAS